MIKYERYTRFREHSADSSLVEPETSKKREKAGGSSGNRSDEMYGMKLSELTEDILREIFLLYEKIVGGRIREYVFSRSSQPMAMQIEYIRDRLSGGGNAAEWCLGSSLNGGESNAKLFVWDERSVYEEGTKKIIDKVIRFSFDPNIISGQEAEKMKKDFEIAVDKFLLETKLPVSAIKL